MIRLEGRTPVLFLDKTFLNVTGGNGNNLVDAVGDELNYQILLANPGNVTLTDVSIAEPLTGLVVNGLTLAPGQIQTYLTTYTLTQADIDSGAFNTSAITAGTITTKDSSTAGRYTFQCCATSSPASRSENGTAMKSAISTAWRTSMP